MTAISIENLDWYFTIGKPHIVCEDYALTGTAPLPHIIVCDGCSTSEHTDIGVRIVAMSARKSLREHFEALQSNLPSYADLGHAVVNRARQVADLLGLESSCLDATLMLAFPYREQIQVYIYGDGYITTVDRKGIFAYLKFAYEQNMPYYLTYWIDKSRRDVYLKTNQEGNAVLTLAEYRDGHEDVRTLNYDAPLVFTFARHDYQLIALTSDGVSSFLAVEENRKIPVLDILQQLVAYKTTKGDFVKRRTRRMLKEYEKQGIYPSDDVSVATLLIGN